jgi:thymidylate synthase (FAD)
MPMKIELFARPQLTSDARLHMDRWREDQGQGPDPEALIEIAGRECYDSGGKGRSSTDYHRHILDVDHGSVLEHAQFTFRISGVSRALTHELVRHRVGVAISQRSTRYVDESDADYVVHPALGAESLVTFDARISARDAYIRVADGIEKSLIARGVDKLQARKQARGAARFYLGNGIETSLIWSANVRALRHVIQMRATDAADAEIRALAVELLKVMQVEVPSYFSDLHIVPAADGLGSVVEVQP